ncbi:MAG: TonB family protein [Gammaproteobacteria bacterium]
MFFKDYKAALIDNGLTQIGSSPKGSTQAQRSLYEALTGEENPRSVFSLLTLLVLLLHVWALTWLKPPEEPVSEAKPLIMEVSMLNLPKPVSAAPPAPVKKTEPLKKPKQKPLARKKPAVAKMKPELARSEPAEDINPQQAQSAIAEATRSASAGSAPAKAAKADAPKFSEANFRANYGFNPKPEYPRIARKRGWQGKVQLKVQVSAQGYSDAVAVHQSSGYDVLDESAVHAVKKWKFIPAKRGEATVASSVIVPIIFKLDN